MPRTRRAYVYPARHFASDSTDRDLPAMGQRFRLKAGYPIRRFPRQARVVLAALKRYGMILADNGSAWYVTGAPHRRWDNDQLHTLQRRSRQRVRGGRHAPPAAALIQHVALEVAPERIAECVAFYALLGFAEVEPPLTLRDRAAWVERGGTQVHLLSVDEPHALPAGHVAVVAKEWEGTLERLADAGHEPEPRREHWGSPRAYVRDPAGNLVELMAFARTAHRRSA